jgi:hypothetical protein
MPCAEWFKLLRHYRRAINMYSEAADGLDGPDYNAAWHSAEAALRSCRAARAALLNHEHDHGCAAGNREVEELVLGDLGQSGG